MSAERSEGVDLKKEIANMEFMGVNDARDIRMVARHFYELGLNARKEGTK